MKNKPSADLHVPPWPVDEEGMPARAFFETLDTKAKWQHFWDTADERSQLHGFIHLNNLVYGEPE